MNQTQHFQARMQQRAMSPEMVDMILLLGRNNGRGDLILLGNKELDQALGKLAQIRRTLEKMRNRGGAGVALDGNRLITVFNRTKKFKRS